MIDLIGRDDDGKSMRHAFISHNLLLFEFPESLCRNRAKRNLPISDDDGELIFFRFILTSNLYSFLSFWYSIALMAKPSNSIVG